MVFTGKRYGARMLSRYVAAAAINTLLGIVVIAVVYTITNKPYETIAISAALGYCYSLTTYHNIAFYRRTGRPPFLRYAVVYLTAFILNSGLTTIALMIYPRFIAVQFAVIPLVVLLQWFASNFWAFKPKRNLI
jgi:hypothetical protein